MKTRFAAALAAALAVALALPAAPARADSPSPCEAAHPGDPEAAADCLAAETRAALQIAGWMAAIVHRANAGEAVSEAADVKRRLACKARHATPDATQMRDTWACMAGE